jgi:hypothetical protein
MIDAILVRTCFSFFFDTEFKFFKNVKMNDLETVEKYCEENNYEIESYKMI